MERKEALEIFGLQEQATQDEIARRYDILSRKFRLSTEVNPDNIRQVEQAHKLLANIEYHDPVAEKRLRERDANPGILARILKMEQTKFDNLVHYYKRPAVFGLIGLVFVGWLLATTVFREPNDFQMLLAGDVYVVSQEQLDAIVIEKLEGVQKPMIQNIVVTEGTDPQMMSAVVQKLMVEIGYGENDLLVLDRYLYSQYAEQGAFVPLDDLLESLGTTAAEQEDLRVAVDSDLLYDGEDGLPLIYGIDVTDSVFLREAEVYGEEMIAVFGHKSSFPEEGRQMMRLLLGTD